MTGTDAAAEGGLETGGTYKPIENYAVIGDMHTVALVGMDGSIDWCCLPRFDSPSVFAAILDHDQGGYFKLASVQPGRNKQMYLPDTNVLITRFLSAEGVGEVVDFMPVEDDPAEKVHQILLRQMEAGDHTDLLEARLVGEDLLRRTVRFWNGWLAGSHYTGRWREMVHRSVLALKLLTYRPTGAIVAAPTTSLPEEIGGVRNWDYRYTWIRDAAFTLNAFMRLGFTEEAACFMEWLEQRAQEGAANGPLQIMYRIDGGHDIPEQTLDHLDGYRGSRPVRVGNAAAEQMQLDIYGELLDSVYLYDQHAAPISYDLWLHLRRMLEWVADNWDRTDEGIWEVRGGQQQFVFSKVQCWVALDRGLRLAANHSLPIDHVRLPSLTTPGPARAATTGRARAMADPYAAIDAHWETPLAVCPDDEPRQLRELVRYATLAPNAHNTRWPLTHHRPCCPRSASVAGGAGGHARVRSRRTKGRCHVASLNQSRTTPGRAYVAATEAGALHDLAARTAPLRLRTT